MMDNVAGFFRDQNKQMKGLLFPKNKEVQQNNANNLKRGWDLTLSWLSREVHIDANDIKPTDDKIAYSFFAVSIFTLLFQIQWHYGLLSMFSFLLQGDWFVPDWLVAVGCSLTATFVCWELIYRDSFIPGIDPPTPFSIKRIHNGRIERHGLHLNYAVPPVIGAMVFSAIYFKLYLI